MLLLQEVMRMERITVNLLELSDSERTEVLEQARTYLRKQVQQERFYRLVSLQGLQKKLGSMIMRWR